jgi:hypothetical protein
MKPQRAVLRITSSASSLRQRMQSVAMRWPLPAHAVAEEEADEAAELMCECKHISYDITFA